jgi:hypothetical protein
MNFRAALLITATACAFLLVAACGGDGGQSAVDSNSSNLQSQAGSSGSSSEASAQYVAIDLHSNTYRGTYGTGVSDGEQAGTAMWFRALLWRGSASSVVDLHPDGFVSSGANAASRGMQAGSGRTTSGQQHALKWAGSASTVVDLDPTGIWGRSEALGISGDQVVGYAETTYPAYPGPLRALLWTSSGVVDLHPSGFEQSTATATDGVQQVGDGDGHALLWSGSANSVVDLHPLGGYIWSRAHGVSGGQQVGMGVYGVLGISAREHALLWKGSAESVVDLHPSGFSESKALAVAGGQQVGLAITADGLFHALLWNGTADSVVDLHVFLPAPFASSVASGIDASGNVIGWAELGTGERHAILWVRQ